MYKRQGLPEVGRWTEVFNSDATVYDGSGIGNFGGVDAVEGAWGGYPARATVQVPPLGAVFFRYDGTNAAGPVDDAADESDAEPRRAIVDADGSPDGAVLSDVVEVDANAIDTTAPVVEADVEASE